MTGGNADENILGFKGSAASVPAELWLEIADSLPVLIAYVDRDERFQFNNLAFEKWLGLTRGQAKGVMVREILGDKLYAAIAPHLHKALQGERGQSETGAPNESGMRTLNATYIPHFLNHQVAGVIIAVTDRCKTELEQRVAARTADLQESNEQMETFCYTVAHDLRAPLRAMQGFSQALLADYSATLDPVGQDYARRITASAERMDLLLQDLVAYTRLCRAELRIESVNLSQAVHNALATLYDEINERGAVVEIVEPLSHVWAHAATLEIMIAHLISNAVKFVKEGARPQVRIWCERSSQDCRFSVRDNGIGIPDQFRERIFKVFERLYGVETYPGTGIGLAIVKKGAERMKAAFGVDSCVGSGSTFWISLRPFADRI